MKLKRSVSCVNSLLCLLVLILDGKTALSGAQQGISLCLGTIIPSLFPFFFLSCFITGRTSGASSRAFIPVRKLCAVPKGAEPILIAGFLGGYPVGARSVGDSWSKGSLHSKDAEHLLSFCSNAGPAFLFGMISGLFTNASAAFWLWAIHVTSAILVSVIHPSGPCMDAVLPEPEKTGSVSSAMRSSLTVMASVCGWVILFRTLIAVLDRWFLWAFPEIIRISLIGMLELTNGCCALSAIAQPELRFVLCSGLLAFGGLCVTMQTCSVISGLPLRHYIAGKLLQTLFSLLLSSALILNIGIPVLLFLLLFAVLTGKNQKRSGNPMFLGV